MRIARADTDGSLPGSVRLLVGGGEVEVDPGPIGRMRERLRERGLGLAKTIQLEVDQAEIEENRPGRRRVGGEFPEIPRRVRGGPV